MKQAKCSELSHWLKLVVRCLCSVLLYSLSLSKNQKKTLSFWSLHKYIYARSLGKCKAQCIVPNWNSDIMITQDEAFSLVYNSLSLCLSTLCYFSFGKEFYPPWGRVRKWNLRRKEIPKREENIYIYINLHPRIQMNEMKRTQNRNHDT